MGRKMPPEKLTVTLTGLFTETVFSGEESDILKLWAGGGVSSS